VNIGMIHTHEASRVFEAAEASTAGCAASELMTAGDTISELRAGSYTVNEVKIAGCMTIYMISTYTTRDEGILPIVSSM
jgi:hypothetical protein